MRGHNNRSDQDSTSSTNNVRLSQFFEKVANISSLASPEWVPSSTDILVSFALVELHRSFVFGVHVQIHFGKAPPGDGNVF